MKLRDLVEAKATEKFPYQTKIIRAMRCKRFWFSNPGCWNEFSELLGRLDISDIVHVSSSADLNSVMIIYVEEVKKIDRAEYDENLEKAP